jgi:hypothetical protein
MRVHAVTTALVAVIAAAAAAAASGAADTGIRPTMRLTKADNARAKQLLPVANDLPDFDPRSSAPTGSPDLRACSELGFAPDVEALVQTGSASSPIWLKHEPLGGSVLPALLVIPDVRVMRTAADAEAFFRRVYGSPLVGRCIAATMSGSRFVVTSVARRPVAGGAPREAGWRIAYEAPLRTPLKPIRYTLDYSFQGRGRANVAFVVVGSQDEIRAAPAVASRLQQATAARLAAVFS